MELGENLFYKITSNVFSVKDNVKLKVIKFSFLLVFEYAIILHYRVTQIKIQTLMET